MMKHMQNYYVEMNNTVRIELDNSAMWVLSRHTMFTFPTPKLLCASYFGQWPQSFSQSLSLWTSLSPCYSYPVSHQGWDQMILFMGSTVTLRSDSHGHITRPEAMASSLGLPATQFLLQHCTQLMFQKQSCEHTSSKPKRLKKCPAVWKISPEVLYNFP